MAENQKNMDQTPEWLGGTGKVQKAYEALLTPRPAAEWHEDFGNVIWYLHPISEPPYCGTPLDSEFPYDLEYDDDEARESLWWTPLPDGNEIQRRIVERMKHAAKSEG